MRTGRARSHLPTWRVSVCAHVLPPVAERTLAGVVGGVATAMIAGLVLGLAGTYSASLALAAGLVAGLGIAAAWRACPATAPTVPGRWIAAAITAACVVGGLHMVHHSEHLLVDRDPGVYATTALGLANQGVLEVPAGREAFGDAPDLLAETRGYPAARDGRTLQPQFPHGFPVVLSLFGERGVFLITPVLVGLAMLCVFAVAARLAGPVAAMAASLGLGLNPLEAIFGRDTYSEILAQVLIWGGLWMTTRAVSARTPGPALAAGIVLGSATAARLDSLAILPPLALALALALAGMRHRRAPDAGRAVENALWLALAAALAAGFAVVETRLASAAYYSALSRQVLDLAQAAIVCAVAGALLVWVVPVLRWVPSPRVTAALAAFCGALLLAIAAFARFVRPRVETARLDEGDPAVALIGALQERAGRSPIDPTLSYSEDTMIWLEWYLGPVVLAAGILGLAAAAVWVVRAGFPADLTIALGIVLGLSALYLTDPRITPDHVWAMRRFLPVVLPGIVIAAAGCGALLLSRRRTGRGLPAAAGAALLAAVVIWPAADLWDERVREQRGLRAATADICDAAGEDGALVILPPAAAGVRPSEDLQPIYAPALRSLCDVPVAIAPGDLGPRRLRELSGQVARGGRRLVLIANAPVRIPGLPLPGAPVVDIFYDRYRLQVESRPPADAPDRLRLTVWVIPVPPVA